MLLRSLLLFCVALLLCGMPLHAQQIVTVPVRFCDSHIDSLANVRSFNGIAIDAQGVIYATEWNSSYIVRIVPGDSCAGVVRQRVGSGRSTEAQVAFSHGLCIDRSGNIYATEYNGGIVRKITPDGTVLVVAGTGGPGDRRDEVPATTAQLSSLNMVVVSPTGELYLSDERNHVIRKVTTDGFIHTVAGTYGSKGYSGDGGPATDAQLHTPYGLALAADGSLFISDMRNNVVRRVSAKGRITTIAGNGRRGYTGDGGPATDATLNKPTGITLDKAGNLYIADEDNHVVRKVTRDGTITTFAGTGLGGRSGTGIPATASKLSNPRDVATDEAGNLYIIDFNRDNLSRIHKVVSVAQAAEATVNVSVNADNELVVAVTGAVYRRAVVTDARGREVYNAPVTTGTFRIDVSTFAPGVYSLRLSDGAATRTVSFVKSE